MSNRNQDLLRLFVLADASSIHTEKWLRGLADSGPIEMRLVTMNQAGVRPGLRDIGQLKRIDEFYAGPVSERGGNWRYVLNMPRVLRAVRRMKPDAILAIYLSSYGLMAALTKGDAVLAQVLIGSDVMIAPSPTRIYESLSRLALARADLIVGASKTISDKAAVLADIPPDAILTQQYGLEDWVLDYRVTRKTYGFVSNRAWVPNSQIPLLLRMFGRLQTRESLALVGGGGSDDAEIRHQAVMDPRIEVLGTIPHRQNIDVVAHARFYLSMTASDGASLSLMEAMALGAIPLVSDIDSNREWIEQDINGALLPLGDEAAAASRIESLLAESVSRLEEMRRRNREIVRDRGSLTRNMATFRAKLVEVLEQRMGTDS